MSDTSNQFITHMEFLGYEIESLTDNEDYLVTDETIGNTVFRFREKISVFYTVWTLKNYSHSVRNACLEAVNNLNAESKFSTCTLEIREDEVGVVKVSACYVGGYDKKTFAYFWDLYKEHSTTRIVHDEALRDFFI